MTVNRSDFQRRFKAEPDADDRFIGHDPGDGTGDPFVTDLAGLAAGLAPIIATDASAISVLDTAGNYTATDVEAVLAELPSRYASSQAGLAAAIAPRFRAPSDIIQRFQSGHGWGGATGDSTTDYIFGTQSTYVTTGGGGTAINFCRKTGISPARDMTNKSLRIWLKADTTTNLNSVIVYAGSSSFTNFYTADITTWILTTGEWFCYELVPEDFSTGGGSPNWNNIDCIQIRVQDNSAGTVTMRCNGIELVPESTNTLWTGGVVSIDFDDNYDSVWRNARPVMDARGFSANCYVIQDTVGASTDITATGTYMNIGKLRHLQDFAGWDICAHAHTAADHEARFTTMTDADLEEALRAHKTWLRENGFNGADYIAYPGGQHDADVRAITGRYFTTGRTTKSRPRQEFPPIQPLRTRAIPITEPTATATLTAAIDAAIANRQWLQLIFHQIVASPASGSGTEYSTANFTTVMDYLVTTGVPVRTVSQVLGHRL